MLSESLMLPESLIRRLLQKLLSRGGELAEIYLENTSKTTFFYEDKRVDRAAYGSDRGVGLRLVRNLNTAYGYGNDLSPAALMALAQSLSLSAPAAVTPRGIATAQGASAARGAGRSSNKISALARQGATFRPRVVIDPRSVPSATKVRLCELANRLAWGSDPRIVQVRVRYEDSHSLRVIVNSLGEWRESERPHVLLSVTVTVKGASGLHTGYESIGGLSGHEVLTEAAITATVRDAVRRALNNLTGRPTPSGAMTVVIASSSGGTFVHEAVGHGLEADLVFDNQSVFAGRLGSRVASELVTVIDDASIPGRQGSFSFDDEGTPSQPTILIAKGVLKNFLCDRLFAMRQGLRPTGNGRRESYEFPPIVRMTNTMMMPGRDDPAEIIRSVQRGLLVKKMGGGQVNTVNGDFVFEVEESYVLEHGAQGDPVRGATLVGNCLKVLKTIDRVGTDQGFSIGVCGKDGQGVPVTDAMPTVRIPEIVVGGV